MSGAVREKGRKIAVSVDEDGEDEREGSGKREEVDEGELGGSEGPAIDEERDERRHVDESLDRLLQRAADLRSAAEAVRRRVDPLRRPGKNRAEHLHEAMLKQIVGMRRR